ncbi:hypothetical protein PR202_gb25893 [Eleusine coracana subsp. coracana]|uniref:Uncharacterized protein n=1 Tax=Eleusine coracana subsp. coracana TaxID=191504 RepID=A0AAV5FMN5_ELECO|nr:hypothetical protein PR202_gb25893 [Eleusine coracana subsp. coracana]
MDTIFDAWWGNTSSVVPELQKKGLNSLVMLGAWTLWTHRNGIVFDGLSPNLNRAITITNEEKRLSEMAGTRSLSSLPSAGDGV